MQRAAKTIRWSGKAWGLAFCLLSCLFFVLFQGGKLSLMLFIMVSTLTAYLVLGRWSGIASAQGRRELAGVTNGSTLPAGVSLKVDIRISIPGFWPLPYVTVKDRLVRKGGDVQLYEGTFVPDWKRRGELSYETPPLNRGLYRYEDIECATKDIFGLFEHKGTVSVPVSFSVLPRTIHIPEWRQLHTLFKGHRNQSAIHGTHRETTQINGVREYIYGDRLSRVHWNATARTGTWKSKEFERESLPKITVLLDRCSAAYRSKEQFELAVSACASMVEFCVHRGMSVGFISHGEHEKFFEPPGRSESRKRIQRHLIEVQPEAKCDLLQLLRDRDRLPPGDSLVLVVSPQRGEAVGKLLHTLQLRGLGACYLWLNADGNGKGKDEWVIAMRGKGISVYPIGRLEDLPAVLGGRSL